jgi:hypothetical protein
MGNANPLSIFMFQNLSNGALWPMGPILTTFITHNFLLKIQGFEGCQFPK